MAAKPTADGEELDVRELQGKQEKIRDLMRRDPRFIGRLIVVRDGTAGCQRMAQQQQALLCFTSGSLACLRCS